MRNVIIVVLFFSTALVLLCSLHVAEATFPGSNGKIVFFAIENNRANIYTMNPDGSSVNQLTSASRPDFDPTWSADGSMIVFASARDRFPESSLYIMNSDGSNVRRVTDDTAGAGDIKPSWSPDGTKIVFERTDEGDSTEILVVNVDGTGEMNISNDPATNDRAPSWSPDGKKIAWMKNNFVNAEIYVMDPDGSNQQNLSNLPGLDELPNWSPDRSKILFRHNLNLWVMNSDGSNKQPIGSEPFPATDAKWSPDGTKIVFVRSAPGRSIDIFTANVDGTDINNISSFVDQDARPDWQPIRMAVGGDFYPIETTSLLLAGTYSTTAWLIPVIVSGIGIGIVITRKHSS